LPHSALCKLILEDGATALAEACGCEVQEPAASAPVVTAPAHAAMAGSPA
jgi:hypothetical protein